MTTEQRNKISGGEVIEETVEQPTVGTVMDPTQKSYTAAEVEAMRANDKEAMSRLHAKAEKAATALKEKEEKAAADAKERERAEMEESERLKLELQEQKDLNEKIKSETMSERIRSRVREVAIREGAIDTDDLVKLMDLSTVVITDDGTITGADEAVKATKEAKPHLFVQPGATGIPLNLGPTRVRASQGVTPEAQAARIAELRSRMVTGKIGD